MLLRILPMLLCAATVLGQEPRELPAAPQDQFDARDAAAEMHQSLREEAGVAATPILLLGTFHFLGSPSDERSSGDAGIFSPVRQAQVEEVLTLLEEFRPTKIALEFPVASQAELAAQYEAFVREGGPEAADERYQLGFKLARRLGLETVYAIDAEGRWLEPRTDPTTYAREHEQTRRLRDEYAGPIANAARRVDSIIQEQTLRDALLFLNTPERLNDSLAEYLMKKLTVGTGAEYPGADGFVSQWYNRNLRIYANILRIIDSPEDRILVIIGAGHAPILAHLLDASLHFDLVAVDAVLGYDRPGAPR